MKKCVVSFADNPFYQDKMRRLKRSLKGNFDGDFLGFTDHKKIHSKPHGEVPYMFKPYSIAMSFALGYDLVLWCDSPIVAIKSIEPVFDYIEEHGYMFFDNIGHSLARWSNDKALRYFQVTREQAMDIQMIMACCMGFRRDAFPLFSPYISLAEELFPGSWDDHRHDQTVMSFIINDLNLKILKGQDTFFAYEAHREVMPIADSVCLISK